MVQITIRLGDLTNYKNDLDAKQREKPSHTIKKKPPIRFTYQSSKYNTPENPQGTCNLGKGRGRLLKSQLNFEFLGIIEDS